MATSDRDKTQRARVRRSPRLSSFVVVSALVGFFVTLMLTGLYPADPALGFTTLFAYFSLYGITGTIGLGIVVWLILDLRSRKRATEVNLERDRS